ncbi:MAG: DHH family phosphoesterase [Rickettsiales bacterium]|jgi:phosphoesterase RecJ-like protein|nr:DHH family phosphoesterase [Rickettsiales bacterium]
MLDEIKKANSIAIMAHKNLDGDAMGALLSMGYFSKNEFGKEPVLVFEGVIPDNLRWVSNGWWMKKAEDIKDNIFDLIILLDTADVNNQIDDEARAIWANAKRKIKIDHHLNSAEDADINIIRQVAATCEIIANMALDNGWKITKEIASFLYAGIFLDTGGFTYNYTTPATLRTVAALMEFGFDHTVIVRKISEKTKETFSNNIETLGRALFTDDNKIGYAAFSVRKTDEVQRPHRETAWLHQQILSIKDIEATAMFKEVDEGNIQVSIRSKNKPINCFAGEFGGGGHLLAAGFSFNGTLAQAVAVIVPKLQSFINAGV